MNLKLLFLLFFTVFLFLRSICIQKALHIWQLAIALIYIERPFPCSCYSSGLLRHDQRQLCHYTGFLLSSLLSSLEILGFCFAMRQTEESGNAKKHASQYHMQQSAHLKPNAAPVSNERCHQLALWPQAASGSFTFTSLFALLLLLWLFQMESAELNYTKRVLHLI